RSLIDLNRSPEEAFRLSESSTFNGDCSERRQSCRALSLGAENLPANLFSIIELLRYILLNQSLGEIGPPCWFAWIASGHSAEVTLSLFIGATCKTHATQPV